MKPGDLVRFVPFARVNDPVAGPVIVSRAEAGSAILAVSNSDGVEIVYRRQGDRNLLVEYGDMRLDIGLRLRAHLAMTALQRSHLDGIVDLTPGIRSLQVHYDPSVLSRARLLDALSALEGELPAGRAGQWCPAASSICRLSLERSRDPVGGSQVSGSGAAQRALVSGQHRVHSGGSTALDSEARGAANDPRRQLPGHGVGRRLSRCAGRDPARSEASSGDETKYNPARTWTPENAGRDRRRLHVRVWHGGPRRATSCSAEPFRCGTPGGPPQPSRPRGCCASSTRSAFFWSITRSSRRRAPRSRMGPIPSGSRRPNFAMATISPVSPPTRPESRRRRPASRPAFEAERRRWNESGIDTVAEPENLADGEGAARMRRGRRRGAGQRLEGFWSRPGSVVDVGQRLAIIESMKMEFTIASTAKGRVREVRAQPGRHLRAGDVIVIVET